MSAGRGNDTTSAGDDTTRVGNDITEASDDTTGAGDDTTGACHELVTEDRSITQITNQCHLKMTPKKVS